MNELPQENRAHTNRDSSLHAFCNESGIFLIFGVELALDFTSSAALHYSRDRLKVRTKH